MPPLMVVLLASPPPDSICCYFFPVVVNFYVKPIDLVLYSSRKVTPETSMIGNPICWSVVTPFLMLSVTFEKDWTSHLPKGHLILI